MTGTYGIILLAAGSSGRLGQPKQLLQYKNKTLLQYLLDEAKNSLADSVIVVLGAHAEQIQVALQTETVHITLNPDWKEGMASSIRHGIQELQIINPLVEAAILMTCDQPFVTTALLDELVTTHEQSDNLIVTSSYDNTTGPPALFHSTLFRELSQLEGDSGARSIVQRYEKEVARILFPQGNTDIDTPEDYQALP